MPAFGQFSKVGARNREVCFAAMNGRRQPAQACRFRANETHASERQALFDHLVSERLQCGWHSQAELPCGLEIDDKFVG
jgi:hypothetical protein